MFGQGSSTNSPVSLLRSPDSPLISLISSRIASATRLWRALRFRFSVEGTCGSDSELDYDSSRVLLFEIEVPSMIAWGLNVLLELYRVEL